MPGGVPGEDRPEATVPLSRTTDTLHMPLARIEGGGQMLPEMRGDALPNAVADFLDTDGGVSGRA